MEAHWTECEDWMNLTVGYKTYKVIQGHSLDSQFLGEACHAESIIYIEKTQKEPEKINTLLHELIHIMFYLSGLHQILVKKKLEESITECMANMLTDTFKRNPELIQLLNEV
jgi:Zn-dependent peptidase ImmA (M78 family)